jgi:hypothetical protein
MDLSGGWGAAFLGFLVAAYLFSRVILWFGICADVLFVQRRPWQLAFAISLFHSGPWLVLVVAFITYHQRAESWAPWFISGLIVGLVLLLMPVAIVYPALRKSLREDRNAA